MLRGMTAGQRVLFSLVGVGVLGAGCLPGGKATTRAGWNAGETLR